MKSLGRANDAIPDDELLLAMALQSAGARKWKACTGQYYRDAGGWSADTEIATPPRRRAAERRLVVAHPAQHDLLADLGLQGHPQRIRRVEHVHDLDVGAAATLKPDESQRIESRLRHVEGEDGIRRIAGAGGDC